MGSFLETSLHSSFTFSSKRRNLSTFLLKHTIFGASKRLVLSDVLLVGNGPDVKEIFLKSKFRVLAMPFVEGLALRLLNPSTVANLPYD